MKPKMIKRNTLGAAFIALLLCCASPLSYADNLQDANKLFKQGQNEQALEKVDAYLSAQPKDAQGRFLKGLILTELGKSGEAIKVFTGLTQDYPELPEPYNNIAVLYANQGQFDKARQELEMAIRTHPSYATAHENLGDIYAKMASQAYDRALQLDKNNTNTQTKLEMIKELFITHSTKSAVPHTVVAAPKPVVAAAPATPAQVTPPVSEPAKPVAAATPEKSPVNAEAEILKTVQAWAAAWSAKNVKKYLSYYAPDFNTPDGLSRTAWEAQRHDRISRPKSILVEISNAKVKLEDSTHASVSFRQGYRASHLHSHASKTLKLHFSAGKWLIVDEVAGG